MSLTSYDNTIDNKQNKVVTKMGDEQGIIYLVSLINEKKVLHYIYFVYLQIFIHEQALSMPNLNFYTNIIFYNSIFIRISYIMLLHIIIIINQYTRKNSTPEFNSFSSIKETEYYRNPIDLRSNYTKYYSINMHVNINWQLIIIIPIQ